MGPDESASHLMRASDALAVNRSGNRFWRTPREAGRDATLGESRDDRQKVWHSRSGVSERFLRAAGEQALKGVGEPVRVWAVRGD